MKKIKLLALSLLTTVAFAGCQKATDTTITLGTNATFPPFEFIAEDGEGLVGQFSGVDIAIAKKFAESNDYDLIIEDMEFGSLIASLPAGKVDFVAAGMTVTEERQKNADFTIPYYTATQYILVGADSDDVKSLEDLEGKAIGAQASTTGSFIAEEIEGASLSQYSRGIDAIMDLKADKIDAVIIDSLPATSFYENYSDDLKLLTEVEGLESEMYAIAVNKGNDELLDKLNAVIQEMIDSGEIDELVNEYSK